MATKKEKTGKKTVKRDFVTFVKDASKEGSNLGIKFIEKLKEKGVKADDLWQHLDQLGLQRREQLSRTLSNC